MRNRFGEFGFLAGRLGGAAMLTSGCGTTAGSGGIGGGNGPVVCGDQVCDDGNPCTTDLCDSATQACQNLPNKVPCDDGDPCTVGDRCANSGCVPGTGTDVCTADDSGGGDGGGDGGGVGTAAVSATRSPRTRPRPTAPLRTRTIRTVATSTPPRPTPAIPTPPRPTPAIPTPPRPMSAHGTPPHPTPTPSRPAVRW